MADALQNLLIKNGPVLITAATGLVGTFMSTRTTAANTANNAEFQKRNQLELEYLRMAHQNKLEEGRQEFQAKLAMLGHQQAREVQEFVQSVNWAISQENLDFQRWRFEQEKRLQGELAANNRETQFELAAYQRQTTLQLPEINKIVENWPLRIFPSQILNDSKYKKLVPLRVIISPPDIKFDKFANVAQGGSLPKIENTLNEGLKQFLNQHYPLSSQTRPTEFLDGAWDSNRYYGGASIKVLFSMLKSEPTLIIQSEVDGDYLNFRFAYWGVGNQMSDTYCYETIFSRFAYGDILSNAAKTRALKWKETRDKLIAVGRNPEDVNRLGGDNTINLKILQEEEELKQLGIDLSQLPLQYKINYQDFQVFCQFLITGHSLIAGWIADLHYLFYNDTYPVLPTLLSSLLDNKIEPETVRPIVLGYQQICKALESDRPSWTSDIYLQLAQSLTHLPEKTWARGQIYYSTTAWLKQRGIQQIEGVKPLIAMKPIVTAADREYLEKLQECFLAIDDAEAINQLKEIFNSIDDAVPYNIGVEYAKQGQYQSAIQYFNMVIKINPNHAEAHYNRGLAYSKVNDNGLALQDYDKAILLKSEYGVAYLNRGNIYYKNEEYEKAIADYERARDLDFSLNQAEQNRNEALRKLNYKNEKTKENYRRLVEQALLCLDLGDYQGAIADYDQVIKINSNDADAYYNRGVARFKQLDYQGAIADYDACLKINPNYSEASKNRQVALDQISLSSKGKEFEFDIVTIDGFGKEINRSRGKARQQVENLGKGVSLEIVYVPGGTFMMGSPDSEEERSDSESPQHKVTVAPFFMGKTLVTQAQWKAVAALPQINQSLNPDPSNFKDANRPVEKVSWHDAVEFCARLSAKTERSYRLPSEAEWEYACRAGTTTPFHFGETIIPSLANYDGDYTYGSGFKGTYRKQTTPVGSFQVANAFGLYDMHGNVWEWCADAWHENYLGAPSDGNVWEFGGDDTNRMLRGGCWHNYPGGCRSAHRDRFAVVVRYGYYGFRVAVVS